MIFHSCSIVQNREIAQRLNLESNFPFQKFNATEKSKPNLEDHQTVTNKFGLQWFQSGNLTVDLRGLM